jgi:hypothetical protein
VKFRGLVALTVGIAVTCALAPGASAATRTFSGSCTFSGPITPTPPITAVPHPGAHFSYLGTGKCKGKLDGAAVTGAPLTITFVNVATLFDTCELGPDFNLHGEATVGTGASRDRFAIVINLARLALAGPFALNTAGGGLALGVATFQPPSTAGAIQACSAGGVDTATLSGNFTTLTALAGSSDPAL